MPVRRHLHMMRPRTTLYLLIVLFFIALGGIFFFYSLPKQESAQVFPATVNRDCAPWDGSAFTVQIPISDGMLIDISIWRSPEIKFPVTFSFPDNSGQVGNAILIHPVGLPEPLTGTVFFWRVDQESQVEGGFELRTESGNLFKGKFKAEWSDLFALCG